MKAVRFLPNDMRSRHLIILKSYTHIYILRVFYVAVKSRSLGHVALHQLHRTVQEEAAENRSDKISVVILRHSSCFSSCSHFETLNKDFSSERTFGRTRSCAHAIACPANQLSESQSVKINNKKRTDWTKKKKKEHLLVLMSN